MSGADDFKAQQKRFEEIAARLKNMKPVLTVAAEDLRTFVDDRFQTSTGPDGDDWADLSASTLMTRARRGMRKGKRKPKRRRGTPRDPVALHNAIGAVKPLVDTGRLRQSIAVRVAATSITVGTNVDYGEIHQWGGEEIDARPFLPFVKVGENEYALDMHGPSGKLWTDVEAMVREYVKSGKIR